jgi:hypothetical protein
MSITEPVTPAKHPPGKTAGKWSKWLAGHKQEAAVGAGAVGVVGYALYRRSQSEGDATDPTNSTVPADATTAGGVAYDPAASDGSYDPMQSVLSLQTSLDALANADAAKLSSITSTLGKLRHTVKKDNRKQIKAARPPARGKLPHTKITQGPITKRGPEVKHRKGKK